MNDPSLMWRFQWIDSNQVQQESFNSNSINYNGSVCSRSAGWKVVRVPCFVVGWEGKEVLPAGLRVRPHPNLVYFNATPPPERN